MLKMEFAPIHRIALYVRNLPSIASFYGRHFGFEAHFTVKRDRAVLIPAAGGCRLVLLQASKGHRLGQSCVKIIFDVEDVRAMKEAQRELGLEFGAIHQGPGYEFANARDPAKNLIQISSAYLAEEGGA